MLEQIKYRAKAVVALIGTAAARLVATVPDSKAGQIAAAVVGLLTALGVERVANGRKPT